MAYLYDHQNPNAPVRSNGKRFWGYPARQKKIQLVVVHTTESMFDLIGEDTGAEGVARFQSTTTRPSSYHRIVDRDSEIDMLPDGATAFGVVDYNGQSLHIAFAMRAGDWADPEKAKAAEPALYRAARIVATWCHDYGIPDRFISQAEADAGALGLTSHGRLDPDRRSDPGTLFPWTRFLGLIHDHLDEDDMGITPEELRKIVREEARIAIQEHADYMITNQIPVKGDALREIQRHMDFMVEHQIPTKDEVRAEFAMAAAERKSLDSQIKMIRRDLRRFANAIGMIMFKLGVRAEPLVPKAPPPAPAHEIES
jgi:hypothetical protein